MKFLTLSQFVLFICILAKKIECDSVPDNCGPGRFHSEHIPGCAKCSDIASCSDQDSRDVQRCTEACGKKIKCDGASVSLPDCGPRRFYSVHIPGCTGCSGIAKCGDQDACDIQRCKKACAKKIECVPHCGPGLFYSVDIPGCIGCPDNCSAQDDRDVGRCKEACETKTTGAPGHPTTTAIPTVTTLTQETLLVVRSTRRTPKTLQSEHSGPKNSTNVGLAVSLGVLVTFVVCFVAYVTWRCMSKTSRDVVAQVEEGGEPPTNSTSSQESSPAVTKRPQSCPVSSLEEKEEGIRLPIPETEKLISKAKDSHVSSINLEECEN